MSTHFDELWLELDAPYAACRPVATGWFRPTAGFLTHSAACGLVFNVAGVETRLREDEPGHGGKTPASLIRPGLPAFELALGRRGPAPGRTSLFQQLHKYLVGGGGVDPEWTKGTKNNVAPVRRELLVGLKATIVIRAERGFTDRIRDGLNQPSGDRYGIPFVGDNNCLLDRLEEPAQRSPACWYERIAAGEAKKPRPLTERLTIEIDREDMARTRSALFAPTADPSWDVPDSARVWVGGGPRA